MSSVLSLLILNFLPWVRVELSVSEQHVGDCPWLSSCLWSCCFAVETMLQWYKMIYSHYCKRWHIVTTISINLVGWRSGVIGHIVLTHQLGFRLITRYPLSCMHDDACRWSSCWWYSTDYSGRFTNFRHLTWHLYDQPYGTHLNLLSYP